MALCLQREVGEEIVFTVPGPDGKPIEIRIEFTAIRLDRGYQNLRYGQVVVACTAPQEVRILRRELVKSPRQQNTRVKRHG